MTTSGLYWGEPVDGIPARAGAVLSPMFKIKEDFHYATSEEDPIFDDPMRASGRDFMRSVCGVDAWLDLEWNPDITF